MSRVRFPSSPDSGEKEKKLARAVDRCPRAAKVENVTNHSIRMICDATGDYGLRSVRPSPQSGATAPLGPNIGRMTSAFWAGGAVRFFDNSVGDKSCIKTPSSALREGDRGR